MLVVVPVTTIGVTLVSSTNGRVVVAVVSVPAGTTTVDVQVHDMPGSDHRAVVARLVLPDERPD